MRDAVGGLRIAKTLGADVGDAVALGVSATGPWLPGEVDAERIRRTEAGALADEEHGELRGEKMTDVIGESYSCILNNSD